MHGGLVAWLVVAAALAGCGGQAAEPTPTPAAAGDRMRVAGLVESDTLVPLANATVAIAELNLTATTDDVGTFAFPPLPPRVYSVEARHLGYRTLVLVARPETNPGGLDFVLQRALAATPRQDQFHFRGILDCGYEALIFSGSCDAGAKVLGNQTRFSFLLAAGWRTTVVDVLFDPKANPGLDGLRLTVRGQGQADQLDTYQQYGRFHSPKPFTARLEPGGDYTDATAPVDANITRFLLDVYPQGQLYHQACVPATPARPAQCALGAGAGANIEFDLYITVFYVTPAPDGFTIRTDA
ncbi:MAG TPA: carboxypeptidase-like regulatory domain-containing protein [Candidatus Thermoplasmatota archaeon]|nr:carboxypeptidase-like regulatory domain-containing protein [Candidatus Thermoplasmatota archaeon]